MNKYQITLWNRNEQKMVKMTLTADTDTQAVKVAEGANAGYTAIDTLLIG